jgi:hypothetical protein
MFPDSGVTYVPDRTFRPDSSSTIVTHQTPALGDTVAWLAFTARVTALVGDADPLAILAETVTDLRALVGSVPGHALDHTERPGGWSVVGVVEHLAASSPQTRPAVASGCQRPVLSW